MGGVRKSQGEGDSKRVALRGQPFAEASLNAMPSRETLRRWYDEANSVREPREEENKQSRGFYHQGPLSVYVCLCLALRTVLQGRPSRHGRRRASERGSHHGSRGTKPSRGSRLSQVKRKEAKKKRSFVASLTCCFQTPPHPSSLCRRKTPRSAAVGN